IPVIWVAANYDVDKIPASMRQAARAERCRMLCRGGMGFLILRAVTVGAGRNHCQAYLPRIHRDGARSARRTPCDGGCLACQKAFSVRHRPRARPHRSTRIIHEAGVGRTRRYGYTPTSDHWAVSPSSSCDIAVIGGRMTTLDQKNYQAIVIGGGHNGLVCAGYLARAGVRTLVIKRRPILGSAA